MSGEENIELATMPSRRGRGCSTPNRATQQGKPSSSSTATPTRGSPIAACSPCSQRPTTRSRSPSADTGTRISECCYTPEDFAADVDAFMDAVGIEEATLVGAERGPTHNEWR